jgi:hypothetical protein
MSRNLSYCKLKEIVEERPTFALALNVQEVNALGSWIQRFVPSRMEFAVGTYLCVLAGRALRFSK